MSERFIIFWYNFDLDTMIKDAVVATIYRKGELIIPTAKTVLAEGDVLLVAVKTKDLPEVAELIKGE